MSGCAQEMPGMLDSLIEKDGFKRSLIVYKAKLSGQSLDQYIVNSDDEEVRNTYQERIDFLKSLRVKKHLPCK